MKFKVNIHKTEFKQKPDKYQAGTISEEISNVRAIGNGRTWTPATFRGNREAENFVQQQIIVGDIDSGNPSKEEIISKLQQEGFHPNVVHNSFSSTEDNKKWRVIILLSEPLELGCEVKAVTKYLADVLNGDTSVADSARILYGTDKSCEVFSNEPNSVDYLLDKAEGFIKFTENKKRKPVKYYPNDVKELKNRVNNLPAGDKEIFRLMCEDIKLWVADPSIKGSGYETIFKSSVHISTVRWFPKWATIEFIKQEMQKNAEFGPHWRHYSRTDAIISRAWVWAKEKADLRL